MRRISLLLLWTVLVSSCDPMATYNHFVDNQSSHKIFVKIINWNVVQDSVAIDAHSKVLIDTNSDLGGSVSNANCTLVGGSFVAGVIDNNALAVIKDFNNESNWATKIKRGIAGGGTCDCSIIITDADIQ